MKRFSVLLEFSALDFSGGNRFQDSLVEKKMVENIKSDLFPKYAKKYQGNKCRFLRNHA